MPRGAFRSATLRPNGTVAVTGPFRLEPGDPQKDARVAFCLLQGANKIEGDGRWSVGDVDWSGTGGIGLSVGRAKAKGLAVVARDTHPWFRTDRWSSEPDFEVT